MQIYETIDISIDYYTVSFQDQLQDATLEEAMRFTEEQIEYYVETGDPLPEAGAQIAAYNDDTPIDWFYVSGGELWIDDDGHVHGDWRSKSDGSLVDREES